MMSNLFSTFDPSSTLFSFAWLVVLFTALLIKPPLWWIKPTQMKVFNFITSTLKKEVKFTLNNTEKSTEVMILGIFSTILITNIIALFPQNFSLTSHIAVNLPLSLAFWLTLIINGWMNNTNHMLSHLVPQGTPNALMNFMVLIELASNIIRPITLCVRLTANLIAGHLLMTLLGNLLTNLPTSMLILMSVAPLLLAVLESAVACIQAYVFMTLITMYTTEIK